MGAHAQSPDPVRHRGFRGEEDDGNAGFDQVLSQGKTVLPGHHDIQEHQRRTLFPQGIPRRGGILQFGDGIPRQLQVHSGQAADIRFILYQKDHFHRFPFLP